MNNIIFLIILITLFMLYCYFSSVKEGFSEIEPLTSSINHEKYYGTKINNESSDELYSFLFEDSIIKITIMSHNRLKSHMPF